MFGRLVILLAAVLLPVLGTSGLRAEVRAASAILRHNQKSLSKTEEGNNRSDTEKLAIFNTFRSTWGRLPETAKSPYALCDADTPLEHLSFEIPCCGVIRLLDDGRRFAPGMRLPDARSPPLI